MGIRYDRDGVPIAVSDWEYEDWKILHFGIQAIKAAIAERHRDRREQQVRQKEGDDHGRAE